MMAVCSYWSCELKTCLSLYYHWGSSLSLTQPLSWVFCVCVCVFVCLLFHTMVGYQFQFFFYHTVHRKIEYFCFSLVTVIIFIRFLLKISFSFFTSTIPYIIYFYSEPVTVLWSDHIFIWNLKVVEINRYVPINRYIDEIIQKIILHR